MWANWCADFDPVVNRGLLLPHPDFSIRPGCIFEKQNRQKPANYRNAQKWQEMSKRRKWLQL